MKENNLVGFPLGTLKRIEIPKFINGLVKSITASLAKLIVIAPTATSAVPSINSEQLPKHQKIIFYIIDLEIPFTSPFHF